MALFSEQKRNVAARLAASEWKNEEERDRLLQAFRAEHPKPAEFMFLLTQGDLPCRQLGALLARESAGASTLEAILKEAEGRPEAVRKVLIRVAAAQPHKDLVRAVETRLADSVPRARRLIGWQLAFELPATLGRPFIERALRSGEPALQALGLQRLLETVRPQKEPPDILLDLASDPTEAIRLKVLEALERWDHPNVVACMVERCIRDTPAVKKHAFDYLRRHVTAHPDGLNERLVPLIASTDPTVRQGALELLFSCVQPSQALQLVVAHVRNLPGWVRARTIETLTGLGDAVLVGPLRKLLADPDAEVRGQALLVAQSVRHPSFVPALIQLLQDPEWSTRIMAADLLGAMGDPAAVEPLTQALTDPECKWVALESLVHLGAQSALRAIARLLTDPEAENRRDVVAALEHFPKPGVLHILEHLADSDPSEAVRRDAARAARSLARELKIETKATAAVGGGAEITQPLDRVLAQIRSQGASDLHLHVGEAPWVRRNGQFGALDGWGPVSADNVREWLMPILDDSRRQRLAADGQVDVCHVVPDVGRYRCNVYRQRTGLCASFRVIPTAAPTLDGYALPPQLREVLDHHQGLVVLAGPAGAGKSTTMAALIDLINESKPHHIITVEDPVEFVHPIKSSIVSQREVGRHTHSFASALRAALREDPDVIAIGEMRDIETIRMALTAAETGHLVLATLHTVGAAESVSRIVEFFPPDEQAQVRMSLYESLKFVFCQFLVPRADGAGIVPAFEILKCTLSVANAIREAQWHQLQSLMQIGRSVGMQTLEQALTSRVEQGLITLEVAREWRERVDAARQEAAP